MPSSTSPCAAGAITTPFIDLGDQFIQLSLGKTQEADGKRHFGFVVDDRGPVREALDRLGVEPLDQRLNFRDPWGNRIEVVPYVDVQFSKAPNVLGGMGLGGLTKTRTRSPSCVEGGADEEGDGAGVKAEGGEGGRRVT